MIFRLMVLTSVMLMASPRVMAMDVDLTLIGYSFLPVSSAERTATGVSLTLRDGSQRTVDLSYGYLVGFDGHLEQPRILHQHWLRITHAGGRASLVTTSTPLLVLAGICLLLDGFFIVRVIRTRRARVTQEYLENGRDGLSPRPAIRESGDSVPPTL